MEKTPATFAPLATRARAWLFDACFPFWAEHGPDPRGGFRERLALDGSPIADDASRVRVQARQTYVFAQAALHGWRPDLAKALVARGAGAMLGPCRRDDGLFGKMVRPGAGLADDQPEFYDNAFCLIALAYAARAMGDAALLDEAARTLAVMDEKLAHPAGGYHETLPPRLPRRQNPHMHFFEACLALHAASGDRAYLARADRIASLLEGKFVDRRSGALREFFADDWSAASGPDGETTEPGHMFEWTWLLAERAKADGAPAPKIAHRLYAAALPFVDSKGYAPQSAAIGGRAIDGSRRSWPQTEAIKAHLAMAEAGDAAALSRAAALLERFFADYLSGAPPGAWREHFDAKGAPVAADIPASIGYHVVLMLIEFIRVASDERR